MVGQLIAVGAGHFALQRLYPIVTEFVDPAAADADQMVVMNAFVILEDGAPAVEDMAQQQAGAFEL